MILSATLQLLCLRMVANAATGPIFSVQEVLLMNEDLAASMIPLIPIIAAIG